jgi:hypothetical protein
MLNIFIKYLKILPILHQKNGGSRKRWMEKSAKIKKGTRMTKSDNTSWYLGYDYTKIMNSGRDILGEEILRKGFPTFSLMKGILPSIEKGRYLFLSGIASWHGLTVLPDGTVYPQETAVSSSPIPIFSPLEEDLDADRAKTKQCLVEGWIPVVTTSYQLENRSMDITCFVEFGDPDSNPQLWIDIRKSKKKRSCYVISHSRPMQKREISLREFDETFKTTIGEWYRLGRCFNIYTLPYKEMQTGLLAMMANLFQVFTGDHAHYGHLYYGREIHDNFPPSYLSGIEICYSLGMKEHAWGMLSHLLRFGIDIKGRFYYRQGLKDWNGASGSEYGRFFCLVERLWKSNPVAYPLKAHIETLAHMGSYLLSHIQKDQKGRNLLLMCAEADTRSRIRAYTSNNLWAVQGLKSLGNLLQNMGQPEGIRFKIAAGSLYDDLRAMLDEEKLQSPWGPLVPFQSSYTPLPLTLSQCEDSSSGVPSEDYFSQLDFDSDMEIEQDYSQNTYANYRYYAEMLSSGLLSPEESEAIVKMRETKGGELLGMTRFYERLDDWPADNYARYYLETDRLDKYLLLYYAHFLYHGNPDTGVYYEQVTTDGKVFAPDCVPSLTLVPLMTAWMFCYESLVKNEVNLLRGIPEDWLAGEKTIEARCLTCTAGEISIRILSSVSQIRIELDTDKLWKDIVIYLDIHLDPPPSVEIIEILGASMENTSRPGRYRLLMREKQVIITTKK